MSPSAHMLRHWRRLAAALLLSLCTGLGTPALAHLMAPQKGALNLVGGNGFLVLSVPVAVLHSVDDDGDGRLNLAELQAHWQDIESQLRPRLRLIDEAGENSLQDMMLNLAPEHGSEGGGAAYIVVLGRFAMRAPQSALQLALDTFGTAPQEQTLSLTVTRAHETQRLNFTPERPHQSLFAPASAVLADYLREGMEHILGGLDHLLFLLVVVAAGGGWRHTLWALTSFTAGHAVTLTASAAWGWQAPPALVEPAIAATIVGMAAWDGYRRRRQCPTDGARDARWRLLLVFGCALIHGLGLAAALGEFGLDERHRLWSLAGFNLGIELGQLIIVGSAWAALAAMRRLSGPRGETAALEGATIAAMVMGSFWLVQRVTGF